MTTGGDKRPAMYGRLPLDIVPTAWLALDLSVYHTGLDHQIYGPTTGATADAPR